MELVKEKQNEIYGLLAGGRTVFSRQACMPEGLNFPLGTFEDWSYLENIIEDNPDVHDKMVSR